MASFHPNGNTKSAQELEEAVCNLPLLMKELPDDFSDNPVLLGLQSLLYTEGTPIEIAQHLKQQGNEHFVKNTETSFKVALRLYTEALQQPLQDHPNFVSTLLSNRAAVHFSLQQYENCIQDCLKALSLYPQNTKAINRLARCYAKYKHYEKAIEHLQNGLSQFPNDPRLLDTFSLVQQEYNSWKSQLPTTSLPWHSWFEAYQIQNISTPMIPYPTIETSPCNMDDTLYLPVVVWYPEFQQFDHLAQVDIQATFEEMITPLFESPFPWDPEYTVNTIQLYVWNEEQRRHLLFVPLKSTLLETLHQPGVVTFNGVMELVIVHSSNAFSHSFKKNFDSCFRQLASAS